MVYSCAHPIGPIHGLESRYLASCNTVNVVEWPNVRGVCRATMLIRAEATARRDWDADLHDHPEQVVGGFSVAT